MNKRFTLIELLVVVAIIAILASMLIPALGKAKGQGNVAVCVSNLKQIGYWVQLYADDNDGYIPIARDSNNVSYDDTLSNYDGRKLSTTEKEATSLAADKSGNYYRCPLDKRGKTNRTYAINSTDWASDGVLMNLDIINTTSTRILMTERYKQWQGNNSVMGSHNAAQFAAERIWTENPTATGDWYGPNQRSDTTNWDAALHPKRRELPWLMADSHVELGDREKFIYSNYTAK